MHEAPEVIAAPAKGALDTLFHLDTTDIVVGVDGEGDGEEYEMILDKSVVLTV